jgi:hypothetical protein
MYLEIKTDNADELRRVFDDTIKKGQQAMLTLRKDGEFYSLSVNDSVEVAPSDATST